MSDQNTPTPDNSSNPQSGLDGQSTIQTQTSTVDGGRVEDVDKAFSELQQKLNNSQSAYKGLQTNYNKLFEQAQAKDQKIGELESALAEMRQQIEALSGEKEKTSEQLNEINSAAQEAQQKASQAELQAEMYKMVATKYPELGGILETLEPRDSIEATEEMLKGMSDIVNKAAEARVRQQLGDYNPFGSVGRDVGNQLSQEALRIKMAETAGTPEYDMYANQYYTLVQQSGEYPKPKMSELDQLLLN